MTSETAYDDTVVIPEELAVRVSDDEVVASEKAYDAWYEGHFFYNALNNAADALREEAARAFKVGKDDVAFALREMAKGLEDRAQVEASEWEKSRAPK